MPNLHWVKKIFFAVFGEISSFVSLLISRNHSTTCLIFFTKNVSNQRSILSVYGPCTEREKRGSHLPGLADGGRKKVWPFLNFFLFPDSASSLRYSKASCLNYLIHHAGFWIYVEVCQKMFDIYCKIVVRDVVNVFRHS